MVLSAFQSIIRPVRNIVFMRNIKSTHTGCAQVLHPQCRTGLISISKNELFACVILSILLVSSCATILPPEPEEPAMITEDWYIPEGPVQVLRELTWDLHHQKLRVRFNFDEEKVIGATEMLFTSEVSQSELVFDAKTMEFDSIHDVRSDRVFEYVKDSAVVTVLLDREYAAGDTLVLGVSFVSNPPQRGLYFINPRGEDPVKPTQIWTLGQPEDNSFWFPTIDHPAERATQETWISVPDNFQTLSNGLLLDSRVLPGDSLRTDYWRLHQPHTPYLFALAVGEYQIIEEKRGDILYRYYVEPNYVDYVNDIYKNTSDMIRYSEDITGVAYPWDPVYAQAPVHDFIARGMENTTATLLYDAVQFDKRTAQDLSNQDLIMHEIIHQWFGNLVTCKDWANLPLNEGFANYFESAYRLHNDGFDDYLWKNHNDRLSYFDEADYYRRPVIFYQYEIPEDMYDRHTYQKAGQVLRMLHDYLGDDAWWRGVRLWLDRHAFDAVDVFDFQSVFEDASGLDLYYFIDQWFMKPGHPYLEVSHEIYGNRAVLNVNQVQDTSRQPLFDLYPEVLIEFEGGGRRERVHIDKYENEFVFEAKWDIIDIIIDPERVQLAQYFRDISLSTLLKRLKSEHLLVRAEALSMAGDFVEYRTIRDQVADLARNDPFWGIRMTAYAFLSDYAELLDQEKTLDLALSATYQNERKYQVRQEAFGIIRNMEFQDTEYADRVRDHLAEMMADTSYFVSAEAILTAGERFPNEIAELVKPYIDSDSYQDVIKNAITAALIGSAGTETGVISTDNNRFQTLMALAVEPGEKRYSYDALNYILENIRAFDESEYEKMISLFGKRLYDPYQQYRMLAYDAMGKLGATGYLDDLKKILESERLDTDERRTVKDTIRILEYNRLIQEQ